MGKLSVDELLDRGVEKVLPSKAGLTKLLGKKKIKLYQGFDPTGFKLHLGHSIGLRKLMQFADAGHEVIFLFGTGTVLVGDPSQRDTGRALITEKEISENIKDWKRQVSPIVDFSKIKILKNGDWLTKLVLKDIVNIASNISAVQLFKRDSFKKRLAKGNTVWYHETMYPLLQGYDSVHMDVDLEIGGTDQEFNMLIGRELLKKMKKKEKYVITLPMVTGTDGNQMSKSSGNCIWMDDPANEKFGKVMSSLDNQIIPYMTLLTDMALKEIDEFEKGLQSKSTHPFEAKKRLGEEIVTMWHSKEDAKKAREYFEKTFQKKTPKFDQSVKSQGTLAKTIAPFNSLASISEAKRIIRQGGVQVDGEVVTDPNFKTVSGQEIKLGKKTFLKVEN